MARKPHQRPLPDYLANARDRAWVNYGGSALSITPRNVEDLVDAQSRPQLDPAFFGREPLAKSADARPSDLVFQAQLRGELAAHDGILRRRVEITFPSWRGSKSPADLNRTVGFMLMKAELLAATQSRQPPASNLAIATAWDSIADASRPWLPSYINDRPPVRLANKGETATEPFVFLPASELVADREVGWRSVVRSRVSAQFLREVPIFKPQSVVQAQQRAQIAIHHPVLGPIIRKHYGIEGQGVPGKIYLETIGGRLLLSELMAQADATAADRRGEPSADPLDDHVIAVAFEQVMSLELSIRDGRQGSMRQRSNLQL